MNDYFEMLYLENKDMVFRTAYGILKNRTDAEDVTIEVFCKLYIALKSKRNIQNIPAWLCVVSKTTAVDIIRKNSVEYYSLLEPPQKDFTDSVINKVFTDTLLNDLYRKNPKWLEYLSMRYLLQMSYSEIATATKQTEASVKSSIIRAKKYIVQKVTLGNSSDSIYSIIALIVSLIITE